MHLIYYTYVIANRMGHPLENKVKIYLYLWNLWHICSTGQGSKSLESLINMPRSTNLLKSKSSR